MSCTWTYGPSCRRSVRISTWVRPACVRPGIVEIETCSSSTRSMSRSDITEGGTSGSSVVACSRARNELPYEVDHARRPIADTSDAEYREAIRTVGREVTMTSGGVRPIAEVDHHGSKDNDRILRNGEGLTARPRTLERAFYERPAELVAAGLIGKIFSYGPLRGRIVEVEAYDETEPASHGFSGLRKGNATLFGPPGRLEVYLIYGVNYLANVVCQPVGVGSGVLIRALEPLTGMELMRANRGDPRDPDRRLCSGPGRLCKAFGLSRADNDTDLVVGKVRILDDHVALPYARSARVGVSAGQDLDWRFYVDDNPSVSVSRVPVTPMTAAEPRTAP